MDREVPKTKGERMKKTAIVCAHLPTETELEETIKEAKRSAGSGCSVFAVEDKDLSGPGWNRNRGIEAAKGCDVIIVIDAHMRFRGSALKELADAVRQRGGLYTAICHHNTAKAFSGYYDRATGEMLNERTPDCGDASQGYSGARIVLRSRDDKLYQTLTAKWRKTDSPGKCVSVMGACYAFSREWYFAAGQPLAMLRGWGCDEEALSIAAWLSGLNTEVLSCRVAHRYIVRGSFPCRVMQNRSALLNAFVSSPADRADLYSWLRKNDLILGTDAPEVDRVRAAMGKMPRTWEQFKAQAVEPDEIDGTQTLASAMKPQPQKINVQNPVVTRIGITCPHCSTVSESHKITHTYSNGNKRHLCEKCGLPFISALPK